MGIKKVLLISLALLCSSMLIGQGETEPKLEDADPNAAFKASFLFLFSSNVDWPKESKTGEFKIGIVGNTPVFDELVYSFASKPVGAQTLAVSQIDKLENLDQFHIIFVSRKNGDQLESVVKLCKELPILIVSEAPSGLSQGAIANFVIIDSLIRYELDQSQAQEIGLILGTKIIQYAIEP